MLVSILTGDMFTPRSLVKYTNELLELMEDPSTTFMFSDQHPIIATFFHKRGYRKCIVHHLDTLPKHTIGKYKNIGGYTSYSLIEIELLKAELVIRM